MDSDLTFASETARSQTPEADDDLTLAAALSDSETDTHYDGALNSLATTNQPPDSDIIKNLQQINHTNIFRRQAPDVEAVAPLPFSFGRFAPRLVSMSKAMVKPSLLFRHAQQAFNSVDNVQAADTNAIPTTSLRDSVTGDGGLSAHEDIAQPTMSDQYEAVSSPPDRDGPELLGSSSTSPVARDEIAREVTKRPLTQGDDTLEPHTKRKRLAHRHQVRQPGSQASSTTTKSSSPTPPGLAFATQSNVQHVRPINTTKAQRRSSAFSRIADNPAEVIRTDSAASTMPHKESTTTSGDGSAIPMGRHEMKEALQIVAHTWAKAQMSAGQRAQSLAQDLHLAEARVLELTQRLETAMLESAQHAADSAARAEREDGWRRRSNKLKEVMHSLQSELSALRNDADIQHEALIVERDKIGYLKTIVAKLGSQLLRRAKRTQKISTKMMKVMNSMDGQMKSSQLAAEYLLMQLEEKTGLLVEARDELNTLRARQIDTSSTTEQLSTKTEVGQSMIIERMEALHVSSTQTEEVVNTLLSAKDSFESATQKRKIESATLNATLAELVNRSNDWFSQCAHLDNKPRLIDTQIIDESLARMTEVIGSKLDALKHETSLPMELCELQKSLTLSTAQVAELTSQLSAKEAVSFATRAELERVTYELARLADLEAEDVQSSLNAIKDEILRLRDCEEEYECIFEDQHGEYVVVSSQLADSREECDLLRKQLAKAETEICTASATIAQQQESEKSALIHRDQLASGHAGVIQELELAHEMASRNARDEFAHELQDVQGQLEQSRKQKSIVDELLKITTAERDDLRDGLRSMAVECDLHLHGTPLLEEELAILREQLCTATASMTENAAALSTAQEKHRMEISNLKAELDSCQQRSNVASATAKQNKVAKDDLSVQVKMLRSSVGELKTALSKSENSHLHSNELAEQFKCNVDKMWKKEGERHNNDLARLRTGHIQLEAEMLHAENHAVQLTEKLMFAQQNISELHAQLDKAASSNQQQCEPGSISEPPMTARSFSRYRHTPESVMNELFGFFSNAAGRDTLRPESQPRETSLVAPKHNNLISKLGSDAVSNHSLTSAQGNSANRALLGVQHQQGIKVAHNSVCRPPGTYTHDDARLISTFEAARHNGPTLAQSPVENTTSFQLADEAGIVESEHGRSLFKTAPQHGSSQKRQPGNHTDRLEFSYMLLSTASSRSEYGTLQTPAAKQTSSSKSYRKLKALAKSGRAPLSKVAGNNRSRPHLAMLSKQKFSERFNQER